MRRKRLYETVALLLASAALPRQVAAQAADVRPVKPLMMLLVDTSGSMEYLPDTASAKDVLPSCANTAADMNQKSRWAITAEALTGTISDFRCVRRDRAFYNDFDKQYHIPHFEITKADGLTLTHATGTDGVLDAFKDRLKFGLMTFDGVLTTIGGRALEPFTSYEDSGYRAKINGSEGMWSYPIGEKEDSTSVDSFGWVKLDYPTCPTPYGINAGARGPGTTPGSLISVGELDSTSAVSAVNEKIQSDLLKIRPYGGTPIAAMLEDFRYYMRNDPDVNAKDPYRECRKRYAVLLTDGAPDKLFRDDPSIRCEDQKEGCAGSDCCPYELETETTKRLVTDDKLDKLWVVAFNVQDQTALAALNDIAKEGKSTEAIQVLTASKLRATLSRLMSESGPDATSRSVPVVVNTGRAVMLGGKQYEISAGFRVGTFDEPWEGYLFRRRITCTGVDPVTQPLDADKGDMFHTTLNKRTASERTLLTIAPTSRNTGNLFSTTPTTLTSTAYTAVTRNELRQDGLAFAVTPPTEPSTATRQTNQSARQDDVTTTNFDGNLLASYFDDANGNGINGENADRDWVHGFVRGITPPNDELWPDRSLKKLSDIYHSNPVVMPPIMPGSDDLNVFDPYLREFYTAELLRAESGAASTKIKIAHLPTTYYGSAGRPGVVFVGTNDGVLHAFNLDDWPANQTEAKIKGGEELWGFIPPALFGKLAAAAAPTHQVMFDGTPVVKDVVYKRVTTTANAQPVMGTALVVGVRGAASYVAIDVTYPDQPKFLWQRSFAHLGMTVATPAIGHVKIKWGGTETHVRAVAILPGGEGESIPTTTGCDVNVNNRGKAPNTGARDKVRCWGLRGRSLYVVDIATGQLIQEFDARHFPSPMNGSVALDSDAEPLAQTRGAYLTDADGVLWRLWMNNPDPTKWKVMPIWDIFGGQAAKVPTSEPSAVDGASSEDVDVPSPTYSAGHTSQNPPLLNRDKQGNLTIVVGTGDVDGLIDTIPHRVISLQETRALDSEGNLTSSTKLVANWKLQLQNGEGVTGPLSVFDDALYFASFKGPPPDATNMCALGTTRIFGVHVREKSGALLPKAMLMPESGTVKVLYYYPSNAATKNSLLLGLSINKEPVCVAGVPSNDPFSLLPSRVSGQTGGGGFKLRSMVAGGAGGTVMEGSTATGFNGLRQVERTLPIPNVATTVGWASSIE